MAKGKFVFVKGLAHVRNTLRLTPADMTDIATALFVSASEVMDESQELVPVLTGNLKSTGEVGRPDIKGPQVEVQMKYGGGAAPGKAFPAPGVLKGGIVQYDLLQHEEHSSSSKFLEKPAIAAIPRTMATLVTLGATKMVLRRRFRGR